MCAVHVEVALQAEPGVRFRVGVRVGVRVAFAVRVWVSVCVPCMLRLRSRPSLRLG